MKRVIILLFILVFVSGVFATRDISTRPTLLHATDSLKIWEKLTIQVDPKIHEMLKQQDDQNKRSGTMSGFRLQIYFGSGEKAHAQAIKTKTEFLSSNPDVKVYLFFKSPDFIVRVGNFRTKSEALKMQKSLLFQYPNAFIVADEIALPELLNSTTNN